MKRGLFITFEGGDGAGKSTQIHRLASALQGQGYQVLLTREPGGTAIGEKIREILLDPGNAAMIPMTECLLYAAARAQIVSEVIRPALENGTIVICDRFLDSSIAYQAYGRSLGDAVAAINDYAVQDVMPDLTIYLRLDPAAGRARIEARAQDRMESQSDAFHRRVFAGYEALCERFPQRILAVDAGASIERIADEIHREVMKRIHERDV